MKILFETSGGFAYLPGMSKPLLIDTTQAGTAGADQLETLVRKAGFFDQPAHSSKTTKGAADYVTYTITVEEGPRKHKITVTDPVSDENLHHLIAHLRNLARSARP